ncbi:MAG: 50S ribosomal protein L37e [Thaumarchaeota archaeon]|nr:50S ribosomal protein L37e [Nitrososphaerota archaeon]MCZ6616241.1 50S ribosomal protein L37e [Nitrososphaerota archaeon]
MVKGTTSAGNKSKGGTHIICRRCGNHAYHIRKKKCASCGFGGSATIRRYSWKTNFR